MIWTLRNLGWISVLLQILPSELDKCSCLTDLSASVPLLRLSIYCVRLDCKLFRLGLIVYMQCLVQGCDLSQVQYYNKNKSCHIGFLGTQWKARHFCCWWLRRVSKGTYTCEIIPFHHAKTQNYFALYLGCVSLEQYLKKSKRKERKNIIF